MAKYSGMIGFGYSEQGANDVTLIEIIEKPYYGDVTKNYYRNQPGEDLNDNITVDNVISIVSNPYLSENLASLKYVTWNGSKWKISSVEINHPRVNLTIGGVYNGQ